MAGKRKSNITYCIYIVIDMKTNSLCIQKWAIITILILCQPTIMLSQSISNGTKSICRKYMFTMVDSVTYTNYMAKYGDKYSGLFLSMLIACSDNSHGTHVFGSINFVLSDMYDQIDYADSTTLKEYLLFAQKGMLENDWLACCQLAEYYSLVEIDSLKARAAIEKAIINLPNAPDSIDMEVNWFMNEFWQNKKCQRPIPTTQEYSNHKHFQPTRRGCQKSILQDGNIQAYDMLIEMARKDKRNPYAFNECLYYCMLMANKYSYEPAFGHVREILLSFYPRQPIEEMDTLSQQLIQLYTRPWMESLPHCPQPTSEPIVEH